jgi:hypothetical protein
VKNETVDVIKSPNRRKVMKAKVFWIFGILQSLSLGFIIFLILNTLSTTNEVSGIGLDTQIILSISFPLFLLLVEYIIYTKEKSS